MSIYLKKKKNQSRCKSQFWSRCPENFLWHQAKVKTNKTPKYQTQRDGDPLLPEARIPVRSPAYCSGTKDSWRPCISAMHNISSVTGRMHYAVVARVPYQDYSSKKLEEQKPKVTCRRWLSSSAISVSSHKKSQCRLNCRQTHHVSALRFFCFSPLLIHLERTAQAERHRMETQK